MQPLAFAAEHEGGGGIKLDLVVVLLAALIEAVDPEAAFLKPVQFLADVADADDGQMFDGAGGSLGDGFGEAGGAAFGDENGIGAGGVGGADDGAEVVRIFDAIEQDEALGVGQDVFFGRVLLGRAEGDDALMGGALHDAVNGFAGFKTHGDLGLAAKIDDFLELCAAGAFGDQDTVEGAAGTEGLADGMDSSNDTHWVTSIAGTIEKSMPATLQVVTGAGAGEEILIEDGQTLRFGKDQQWAEYAFPDDPRMSPVHFSLTAEGERLTLRDLNSRAGTMVNGVKLPMALLKPGDRIVAGQTAFVIGAGEAAVEEEKEETPAAGAGERLLAEMRKLSEPLYALLDAARDPQILEILGHEGADGQSLFEGQGSEQLLTVAPYLVAIPTQSVLLERLLAEGWGQSWGLYAVSPEPFGEFRARLRQFLMVTDESNRKLFFRFYDPRVLRVYLPTCNPEEVRQFFGPVRRFWIEDEDPQMLVEFTQGAKGLSTRKWPLAATGENPLVAVG